MILEGKDVKKSKGGNSPTLTTRISITKLKRNLYSATVDAPPYASVTLKILTSSDGTLDIALLITVIPRAQESIIP